MYSCNYIFSAVKRISQTLFILGITLWLAGSVCAQKVDCLECHKDKMKGKVVHPAAQMGCDSCHTGVDASSIPHKFTGTKGLKADAPSLCYDCHSKDEFTKKIQHAPVAGGMCLTCHDPHSSSNEALLSAKVPDLCKQCHEDIFKKPHVVINMPPGNHPLTGRWDPNRNGKSFNCLSCHVPHSSAWGKLFRYDAANAKGLCKYCHEFMQ